MIDVSVVITTRNEEKNIGNCLDSINRQDYPRDKIEVIVVDNNSTDNTQEIAKRYNCQLYLYGPERSAQRNFAAHKAIGGFILFLDADMAISEGLISECVQKCRLDHLGSLYIPERITGNGFWINVRDFERSFYNGTVIDCVRFVRRENFLEIGGFDENLTGPEDWDFDRRIREKYTVGIIKSCIYHHEGVFNLKRYLLKKTYYGFSFQKYKNKWGSSDPIIKKQFGFLYRFFGVFLREDGWMKLLMHPILTLGMYLLRFSVGSIYLTKTAKIYFKEKNG
ncbi:MAG: glycosyltransferase [Candidatus Omnitrophica bacterium]|nr:glycosyltransferase [Candidatus Omnitrophota bacterium]